MSDQDPSTQAFTPLGIVCKNRFPFTLACPSFVYPAGYVDNVRLLAPHVDEIQLLFFESRIQSLPSATLIRQLADLAVEGEISYNVHLPSDVYPAHPDAAERRRSIDVLKQILECCTPLAPSTFTLHLNQNPQDAPVLPLSDWQAGMVDSLKKVLPSDVHGRRISVETLDYPFDAAAPIITALDLSVCMDMGHLMVHDMDIGAFLDTWKDRIAIVHLHGVDGPRDHLPLNRLDDLRMRLVVDALRRFSGVVCLEVYSRSGLDASLKHLENRWVEMRNGSR